MKPRFRPGDPVVAVKNIGSRGIWNTTYLVPRGTSGVVQAALDDGFRYNVVVHVPGRNVRASEIGRWRSFVDRS